MQTDMTHTLRDIHTQRAAGILSGLVVRSLLLTSLLLDFDRRAHATYLVKVQQLLEPVKGQPSVLTARREAQDHLGFI